MTETDPSREVPVMPLVISGIVLFLGCVLVGGAAGFIIMNSNRTAQVVPTLTPLPTITPTLTLTPTQEPSPSPEPEETEEPEENGDGEEESEEDTPTPTVQVEEEEEEEETQPPPPTEEPIATEPPPPAVITEAFGLNNIGLSMSQTTFPVNQRIPFTFTVTNPTDESIIVGLMGVSIVGTDVYQTSWRNWEMKPGDVTNHTDAIPAIGDPGQYQLQLAGCFPTAEDCVAGSGQWVSFDFPIDITIQ